MAHKMNRIEITSDYFTHVVTDASDVGQLYEYARETLWNDDDYTIVLARGDGTEVTTCAYFRSTLGRSVLVVEIHIHREGRGLCKRADAAARAWCADFYNRFDWASNREFVTVYDTSPVYDPTRPRVEVEEVPTAWRRNRVRPIDAKTFISLVQSGAMAATKEEG